MAALKVLHVICVIIWLGNFVITGVWSVRAFADGRNELRRFAVREILFTDALFTLVFGTAVTISGILLANRESVPLWATFWTRTALELIIAAGVAWLALLLPLEWQMFARAKRQQSLGGMFAAWNVVGWIITFALFAIVYLMVVKPA